MKDERVSIKFELSAFDRTIEAETSIPKARMRVADLLPVLHAFDDAVIAMATDASESGGHKVSCREGCGACCRQLVPIGEAEAHYLAELVAAMPPERREHVRERFREAQARAGEAMLERLRHRSELADIEARRAIGLEYFRLGVACPFLENEACSIYAQRPMSCREYLVSSPAANCVNPGPDTIEMVPLAHKLSEILYSFSDGQGYEKAQWVPLILALDWVEEQRGAPERVFSAPEMFRNFVWRSAGK